jgi:hypothetical protein
VLQARITLLYLYDVADAVAMDRLAGVPGEVKPERHSSPKSPVPPSAQYQQAPVAFAGHAVGAPTLDGIDARVRVFDYGVISLAFDRPYSGTWADLLALGPTLIDNGALDAQAEECCRAIVSSLAGALERPRQDFLSEDYAVFSVMPQEGVTAERLVGEHGADIARLLRGEAGPLSTQEIDEVLRHRLSYLADDLVVPTWNAAFVYDAEPGADAVVEIMEYGNSQLLQYRYYDQLLDAQLGRLYDQLQAHRQPYLFGARSYTRSARQVHALTIDVRELLDRTENALKFVGDIYAARLFALIGARLGLERWKGNVRDKLQTLDGIYHFAVEQSGIARGEFLELTIIAILVLELILFFLGIMK